MIRGKYYLSTDHNLFYTAESRDAYERALKVESDPIKYLEENGCHLGSAWIYLNLSEGDLIDYDSKELFVYNSGPLWNGTIQSRSFINIQLAENYQMLSQENSDKYDNYIKAILPDVQLTGVTVTKKYKDAMKEMGWKMWKEEKPPVEDVLIFDKFMLNPITGCVTKQHFNGRKLDNGAIYNSDIVAWRPVPDDFPINRTAFWDLFSQENGLKCGVKTQVYRKCHSYRDERGGIKLEWDEMEEITEI